jgi:uncharacterized protein YdhG (YjbR/CyaY superfamily)
MASRRWPTPGRALSQKALVGISPTFGNAGLASSPRSTCRLPEPGLGHERACGVSAGHLDCVAVSAEEVDEYLRGVDEPKRSTLQALRRTILEIVPDPEQVISYRVPAFRVCGKTVAGFAAFTDHLSYLPFSGSVLSQLDVELKGYTMTKSALHLPVERPLPKTIVKKLIAVRVGEIRRGSR